VYFTTTSFLNRKLQYYFLFVIRSIKARKNILWSGLIKGLSIIISIMLVPMTLKCLSILEYGVWLTLSSILTWINYLDIGLANGLRNKLAESIAAGNQKLGQIYVSTTFFLLAVIMASVFLFFLSLQSFIDWAIILNVNPTTVQNLNAVIIFAFAFFCLSLIFKLTGIILIADQRPATNDLITLIGSAVSLLIIFILSRVSRGSLFNVILTFTSVPAIILIISYPIIFATKYRYLKPSIKAIKLQYSRNLMGLGFLFFIMQISSIVIFSSSNIIIAHVLDPEHVTPYNIVFKYFSVVTLMFNIAITPMWSASTEAYAKGDFDWIKNSLKSMLRIWIISVVVIFAMILCSEFVYNMWIGQQVKIPFTLTLIMGVYTVIMLWSVCFSTFLFGIGKLRLQLVNIMIVAILFIPLAIWLGKAIGIYGIVLTLCLTNISGAILNPIQFNRILSGKAIGIWNA
jgi:O-antigen/teichoic acid export membrane protein